MTNPTSRLQRLRRSTAQRALRLLFRPPAPAAPAGTLPRTGIHRILICRAVRTLGNSLMLTPLLHEITETWPGAEIDVVSRSQVAGQIYGGRFNIGKVVRMPSAPARHPLATLRALCQIRQAHYDLVVDPDPHSQSGRLLALLARKQYSLGFGGAGQAGVLSHSAPASAAPPHHALQPVYLLRRALGESPDCRAYPALEFPLTVSEREQGRAALVAVFANRAPMARGCIGIFTDATGDKRFDAAWWHRFMAAMNPGISDFAVVEILSAASVRSQLAPKYPGLYSSHLRQVASVLANLSFFVSADCGVMHLGSAVGTPTVGLFKGTDLREWGPYGGGNRAIDTLGSTPEETAAQVLRAFRAAQPAPASARRTDRPLLHAHD